MVHKKQFDLVLEALTVGWSVKKACAFARISRDTHYERLKKDKDYAKAVVQAPFDGIETRVTVHNLELLTGAVSKSWRAAAWYLEHRRPEEWSLGRLRRS